MAGPVGSTQRNSLWGRGRPQQQDDDPQQPLPDEPEIPDQPMPGNPGGPPVETLPDPPPAPPVDDNPAPPDASRWTPGAPGVPIDGGGAQGLDATIQSRLLELLNRGPVNANDPALVDLRNVHRTASGRAFDRNRAQLAERASARGLSGSGGFETGLQGLAQQRGESEAAFAADTMRQAQVERATELMNALTLGQGRISAQMQDSLQRELAAIQANLQRESMALQNEQFEAGLSQQALIALLMAA